MTAPHLTGTGPGPGTPRPAPPAPPAPQAGGGGGGTAPRASWLIAATVLCVAIPPGTASSADGVQATVSDLASVGLVAVAAALAVTGRTRPSGTAMALLGAVACAAALSTACSPHPLDSLPGYLRVLQIFVLVPLAVTLLVRDRRDFAVTAAAVAVVGVGEAGYGIWQAATGTGASYAGRDVRAVGTFGATDVMGMATVAGFAAFVVVAVALLARGAARVAAWAVLGVLAAGLLLSLSRGSWIAVGIGVLTIMVCVSLRLALRTVLLVTAALIIVVGGLGVGSATLAERARSVVASVDQPDQSVSDRYGLWQSAVAIWQDRPLTGVGVKNFAGYRDAHSSLAVSFAGETADPVHGYQRQPLLSPHNQYLLVLAEQGVVGVTALLGLLVGLASALGARPRPDDPRWLVGAGFTVSIMVNFLYSDLGGPTSVLFAVMLGLAVNAAFHTFAPDRTPRRPPRLAPAGGPGPIPRPRR
ncbi:O-antigen ligase family protein [Actinomadura kijaniata]|uniref:O-antigen ligase family protein n=1 Tax=Actinomadura kijaniata TaxID=46161 RepID=UPI002FE76D0F